MTPLPPVSTLSLSSAWFRAFRPPAARGPGRPRAGRARNKVAPAAQRPKRARTAR